MHIECNNYEMTEWDIYCIKLQVGTELCLKPVDCLKTFKERWFSYCFFAWSVFLYDTPLKLPLDHAQ